MGVLEDAIREHLDLKRKLGASDAELNEQETEALGPTRRDAPEGEAERVEEAPVEEAPVEPAPVEEPEIPEPPEAALPEAGPGTPPAPADPDFGGEAPEQKPPKRDFDFD